jgi:Arc/MetJ-type ribon-helix-helix transcriptional regulator
MTTISVPITDELNKFIDEQVELGKVASKAELIRNAIIKFKDDQFISTILKAKQEIKEGKALAGDLDKLAAGFN